MNASSRKDPSANFVLSGQSTSHPARSEGGSAAQAQAVAERSGSAGRSCSATGTVAQSTGLFMCHNRTLLKEPLGTLTPGWSEDPTAIGFRTSESIEAAGSWWRRVELSRRYTGFDSETGELQTAQTPKDRAIIIAPGMISFKATDPRSVDDYREVWDEDLNTDYPTPKRSVISEFSRPSRSRLMRRVASIAWADHLEADERLVMVTLTMPGDWKAVCPNHTKGKKLLKRLEARYRRATGRKPRFVWKLEFQRRGAPHWHLFGCFNLSVKGETLQAWMSRNWYEVCRSGDEKHLLAGTGIDYRKSLSASDAGRVAAYFAGYSVGKDKEYQHKPPEGWEDETGSVGRFWGVANLPKTEIEIRITRQDLIEAKRLLRRRQKSFRKTKKVTVKRYIRPVEIGPNRHRFRTVNRRFKLKSLVGGDTGCTVFTNDGALLAVDLAQALEAIRVEPTPWPKGLKRPLP